MNVLVIGSGGREHALCWKLAQSKKLTKLFCAPGNAGINEIAECISLGNNNEIVEFSKENNIELVVVGPEQPLVDGLADVLEAAGINVFGCSKKAAQLEGSKAFTKQICKKYDIPTAAYEVFENARSAIKYVRTQNMPIVIKADGLAAGKGVIIAENHVQAEQALHEIFSGKFGAAGAKVVIEEFLTGVEASFFAVCDGKIARALGDAGDHKRAFDGDEGPNTGGMGTYSPSPFVTPEIHGRIMDEIIKPTMDAMAKEGTPFKGVLFAGLMLTADGPKLIEYNVRFGDPETQTIMLRLESDLLEVMLAAAQQNLGDISIKFTEQKALCVVMASKGYPSAYDKNTQINLPEKLDDNTNIFHAGTKSEDNKLLATGGRVLNICATANDFADAQQKAYELVEKIDWPNGFYRKDIGNKALIKLS